MPPTPKEQLSFEFTHQHRDRLLDIILYPNPANPKIIFLKVKHIDERLGRKTEYGALYQINLETNHVFSVTPNIDMAFYENSYFAVPCANGGYAVVKEDNVIFYDDKGEIVGTDLLYTARNNIRIFPLADGGYVVSFLSGDEWRGRTYTTTGKKIGDDLIFLKGQVKSVTPLDKGGFVVVYNDGRVKRKKIRQTAQTYNSKREPIGTKISHIIETDDMSTSQYMKIYPFRNGGFLVTYDGAGRFAQAMTSQGERTGEEVQIDWTQTNVFLLVNGGYLLVESDPGRCIVQLYYESGFKVAGYRTISHSPKWEDLTVSFEGGSYTVSYKDEDGNMQKQKYTPPILAPPKEKIPEPNLEINFEGNTFHIKSNIVPVKVAPPTPTPKVEETTQVDSPTEEPKEEVDTSLFKIEIKFEDEETESTKESVLEELRGKLAELEAEIRQLERKSRRGSLTEQTETTAKLEFARKLKPLLADRIQKLDVMQEAQFQAQKEQLEAKKDERVDQVNSFFDNLTVQALEGKLQEHYPSPDSLSQTLQVLERKKRNYPFIHASSKRSAEELIESFALRSAKGELPGF